MAEESPLNPGVPLATLRFSHDDALGGATAPSERRTELKIGLRCAFRASKQAIRIPATLAPHNSKPNCVNTDQFHFVLDPRVALACRSLLSQIRGQYSQLCVAATLSNPLRIRQQKSEQCRQGQCQLARKRRANSESTDLWVVADMELST